MSNCKYLLVCKVSLYCQSCIKSLVKNLKVCCDCINPCEKFKKAVEAGKVKWDFI